MTRRLRSVLAAWAVPLALVAYRANRRDRERLDQQRAAKKRHRDELITQRRANTHPLCLICLAAKWVTT